MPSSDSAVVTSSKAYVKALLHCYKHPTQAVSGFLVGKAADEESGSCFVSDAYPLFHALPMGAPHPMLEVAYTHVQAAAKLNGMVLLGVYLANERLDDTSISPLTKTYLDWLQGRLPSGCRLLVWMVQNERLTTPPAPGEVALESFYYNSNDALTRHTSGRTQGGSRLHFGRWNADRVSAEADGTADSAVDDLHNALDAFAQYKLVDLEDHLEDPRLNYLVQPLEELSNRKA